MHGVRYWLVQYLIAAASMFVLMLALGAMEGKPLGDELGIKVAYAAAAAAVFIGFRYSRGRKP